MRRAIDPFSNESCDALPCQCHTATACVRHALHACRTRYMDSLHERYPAMMQLTHSIFLQRFVCNAMKCAPSLSVFAHVARHVAGTQPGPRFSAV